MRLKENYRKLSNIFNLANNAAFTAVEKKNT